MNSVKSNCDSIKGVVLAAPAPTKPGFKHLPQPPFRCVNVTAGDGMEGVGTAAFFADTKDQITAVRDFAARVAVAAPQHPGQLTQHNMVCISIPCKHAKRFRRFSLDWQILS